MPTDYATYCRGTDQNPQEVSPKVGPVVDVFDVVLAAQEFLSDVGGLFELSSVRGTIGPAKFAVVRLESLASPVLEPENTPSLWVGFECQANWCRAIHLGLPVPMKDTGVRWLLGGSVVKYLSYAAPAFENCQPSSRRVRARRVAAAVGSNVANAVGSPSEASAAGVREGLR